MFLKKQKSYLKRTKDEMDRHEEINKNKLKIGKMKENLDKKSNHDSSDFKKDLLIACKELVEEPQKFQNTINWQTKFPQRHLYKGILCI